MLIRPLLVSSSLGHLSALANASASMNALSQKRISTKLAGSRRGAAQSLLSLSCLSSPSERCHFTFAQSAGFSSFGTNASTAASASPAASAAASASSAASAAAKPAAAFSKGLAGVIAGESAISTVGKAGLGLMYRGYAITDLAANCVYEEIAFLLLYGRLPSKEELIQYKRRLASFRKLTPSVRAALELMPAHAHPMNVQAAIVAYLGTAQPEAKNWSQIDVFDSLIALLGPATLYWHHYHRSGIRIETSGPDTETIAENFVRCMANAQPGTEPSKEAVKAIDTSLILYAEHGFAASSFSARVVVSTLSDSYSAVSAAIGALRGSLHGGANEAAFELISQFKNPTDAERGIRDMLKTKQLIMGFGHRIYRNGDPRHHIIKDCSKKLTTGTGSGVHPRPDLFAICERIEKVMWDERKLLPNLDFYAATAYHQCGVPTEFFTPIFVIARTAGWGAHIMEQRKDNKLFRPDALYTGPAKLAFQHIDERQTNQATAF